MQVETGMVEVGAAQPRAAGSGYVSDLAVSVDPLGSTVAPENMLIELPAHLFMVADVYYDVNTILR